MKLHQNFLWGTATSSYQVEGAVKEEGRGPSIWDTFTRMRGTIIDRQHADVTCDQFHHYRTDVQLMHEMNVGAYRFSLAWSRIFPENMREQNPNGFDYYKRLLDELQQHNITPVVTLYHWDLPQYLQDGGGWVNRDTAHHFSDYAGACFNALGDRVPMWITLNEPFCSAFLGHLWGIHAPGIKNRADAYWALHHLLLGHGMTVGQFRSRYQKDKNKKIGITLNMSTPRPATQRHEDTVAADRAADMGTRMFLGPLFGSQYPVRHINAYHDISMPIQDGDMNSIAQKIDFLGVNYYTEDAVAYSPDAPERFHAVPQHYSITEMAGWYEVPRGLYRHLCIVHKMIKSYGTKSIPLYITENGCAMPDTLIYGKCHDIRRIEYIKTHIHAIFDAVQDGVPVHGYFYWSLIDNFEWAYGYTKRFGLIYCDYKNQKRIPKDSFYYFRDLIANIDR